PCFSYRSCLPTGKIACRLVISRSLDLDLDGYFGEYCPTVWFALTARDGADRLNRGRLNLCFDHFSRSGSGMNSASSPGGSWNRPCSQSPLRQASLAASIFSCDDATKFHEI